LAQWGGRPRGPLAAPGTYTAKLTVAGKSYTVPLEVRADPRLKATPADLARQFQLASAIARRTREANDAVNQIRDLREQLHGFRERFEKNAGAKAVLATADALDKKMTPVEEEIAQTKSKASEDPLNFPIRLNNKLLLLQETVESADTAPTQQSVAVFDLLSKQLDAALAQWHQILSADVPALNQAIRNANLPAISVASGAE
jgi:hypothetical protein